MTGKTLFILNPVSGRSVKKKAYKALKQAIANNPDYDIIESEYHGHITEIASRHQQNYKTMVAVGGDGTINELATGLAHSSTVMGIIPFGSGNGLAHHLNIPDNWQAALKLLEAESPKPIDIIQVNNKVVINVGGLGFDGHVANLFNKSANRGKLAYMKLILKELVTYKEFDYEIRSANIRDHGKAFIMAIANGSEFGNRFKVAAGAEHNDGLINLVVIKKPPFFKLIWLLIQGYLGKLKPSKFYQVYLLEKATISFKNSIVHVDGEIDESLLGSPLVLNIKKGALKIYY